MAPPLLMLVLVILLGPATVLAGEALPQLKGAWDAESLNDKPPEPGVTMTMTFVDDDTIAMEVTFEGETQKEEIRYTATEDGKMTIYPEPDTNPKGEKATWKIVDKKLHLTTAENEVLIFKRPG